MEIVKVSDCVCVYPDGTKALKNITFSVERGESVAVLGENGAGKSTLILTLTGFMLPASGYVEIAGLKLEKKNIREIRKKAGIVFQDPDDQLFMPTVYEDIAFGVHNMGLTGDALRVRVEEAMRATGTTQLRDREPGRLSGGEKRRAAIAGVIAMKPEILIMDEPTAGLDYRSKKRLLEILQEVGSTKIIAAHDMDFAAAVCNKALILYEGEIMAYGPLQDILKNAPLLEACNLEPPRL